MTAGEPEHGGGAGLVPLDWIMLRAGDVKALLVGRGLSNARVIGWAGAGKDFPVAAEIAVDLPEATDLTAGDLAVLDREVSSLVGLEVVVVPQRPGERDMLPGERVRYL
ncbi:hypothetical protein [Propionibacterium freudenreichii]|uniref:hypothetical protein n=1 Tax=Propionibacterium freudenreichii TaxID=1744 RepID=UPI000542963D|nr:hypothetical protein [Propionibacterium freudenreichii]MDK9351923.1 hypothetical protein [Propionibacterium freudenreichii]CEH05310.1 Protein of unknown function [Propionibacterium freudenreichii]